MPSNISQHPLAKIGSVFRSPSSAPLMGGAEDGRSGGTANFALAGLFFAGPWIAKLYVLVTRKDSLTSDTDVSKMHLLETAFLKASSDFTGKLSTDRNFSKHSPCKVSLTGSYLIQLFQRISRV